MKIMGNCIVTLRHEILASLNCYMYCQFIKANVIPNLSKEAHAHHTLDDVQCGLHNIDATDMVGVRILECSSHYYLLRHQLYCRSMLKIVPITNDFFTQRPYHDLASAKSKWQISFCFYNEHSNALSQLTFSQISNNSLL